MRLTTTRSGWIALMAALLVLCRPVQAQLQVGNETSMNLSGNVSMGFNGVYSNVDQTQLDFGGTADLTGFYHDARFLSFRVSPYYNQSRLNSDFNSTYGAKGVNASANLFSGSHTPISFSFEKAYNNEEQFSVPGGIGYTTNGDSQSFSVGAGLFFEGKPTLQASYTTTSDTYELLGSQLGGNGDSQSFTVGTSYNLAGFALGASYSRTHIHQETPWITDVSLSQLDDTNDNSFQVNASRQLTDWANFSANFSRTDFTTNYTGTLTDETFNTVNTNVGIRPTDRLYVNVFLTYTSNLGAFLLNPLIITPVQGLSATTATASAANTTAAPVTTSEFNSDYLIYGTRAMYRITHDLEADGGASRISQSYLGLDLGSENADGGLGYSHRFWGGQFAAHGGGSVYTDTTGQVSKGGSASVSYSRTVRGWQGSTGVQYNRNMQTAFLQYTSSGYNFNINASHPVGTWLMTFSARVGKAMIQNLGNSDMLTDAFSASLSNHKLSIYGSYGTTSGDSLQTPSGLIPITVPGQIIVPNLLVLYSGQTYAFGVGYQPKRRLRIASSYIDTKYNTNNVFTMSDNEVMRYDIRAEYAFRQMYFTAGYSHAKQGIGVTFTNPAIIDAVYFGVSRHIDVF